MKVVVIGRSGQVAQSLAASAHGTDVVLMCLGRPDIDLLKPETITHAIRVHTPDVVVNAAAYTAVDRAESEQDLAFAINASGAGHVADTCARAGIPLIHISTDYVFDGLSDRPYLETDACDPVNTYGRSKLAGEQMIQARCPRHVILRTSWVYAPHGQNFVRTMLRLARERDQVQVVADQVGAPTSAIDISAAISAIARQAGSLPAERWAGVYHYTARGATTWAGFAEHIFARLEKSGRTRPQVLPISTADYPTAAMRPRNSRMDCSKFDAAFAAQRQNWEAAADMCIDMILQTGHGSVTP